MIAAIVALSLAFQADTLHLDKGTYIGQYPSGQGKFYHNEKGLYVGWHDRAVISGRGLRFKPDGSKWRIGIADPNSPDNYLGILTAGEIAVVTSGSYQRFFEFDGNTYHHIINPQSGAPANNGLLSATIICEDGTLADALSTAMFVLGETRALNYWRAYGGFEMILINKSNQVICTKGLIDVYKANENAGDYKLKYAE